MRSDCGKHTPEHRRSEASRLRIIAATVIAIVENKPVRQFVSRAVPERVVAASGADRHEHSRVCDSTECKDDRMRWQGFDFFGKKRVAAANFRW